MSNAVQTLENRLKTAYIRFDMEFPCQTRLTWSSMSNISMSSMSNAFGMESPCQMLAVLAVRAVWAAVCDCFGFGFSLGCFKLFGLFRLLGAVGVGNGSLQSAMGLLLQTHSLQSPIGVLCRTHSSLSVFQLLRFGAAGK